MGRSGPTSTKLAAWGWQSPTGGGREHRDATWSGASAAASSRTGGVPWGLQSVWRGVGAQATPCGSDTVLRGGEARDDDMPGKWSGCGRGDSWAQASKDFELHPDGKVRMRSWHASAGRGSCGRHRLEAMVHFEVTMRTTVRLSRGEVGVQPAD